MRVPVAQRQVAATPLRGGRQQLAVSAETFGAGQGRELEEGGQLLTEAADDAAGAIIDAARRQNETEVRQAIADWQRQTTPVLVGYQSQQGQNAVNGYSALPGQLDGITAQVRGQLSSDRARELFDQSILPRRTSVNATTGAHYHRELRSYEIGALGAQFAASVEQGIAVPETIGQQTREIRAAALELQALTGESDEEREGRILSAVTSMHSGVVDRLLADGNVTVAAAHYQTHREAMLPSEQARVGRRIETARKQGMALAQAQLRSGIQDEIASLRRTGQRAGVVTNDQIRAAYGEQADGIIQGLDREAAFFEVRQEVATNSPAEDAALLESLRPEGENFAEEAERHDMLLKATQDKATALAADPAAYVLSSNPQIQAAYQAAQQDPSLLPQAITFSLREQERLGVPPWQTRALTAQQAEELKAQAQNVAASARAQQLAVMETTYGPHWPQVYGEMVRAGLEPETKTLAIVADSPGVSQTLGQAIEVGRDELVRGLDPSASQDVRVAINGALTDFRLAFEAGDRTGGAADEMNDHIASIEMLALVYHRRGLDIPEAAEKAAEDVLLSRFHVFSDERLRAYAPRVFNGQPLSASSIEDGAALLLDREAVERFDPLPISDIIDTDSVIDRELTVLAAIESGYWVTNETGTGLVLMIPFADGSAIPLLNRNGGRYERGFDEVAGAAIAVAGDRDIRRGPQIPSAPAPEFRPRSIPTPERFEQEAGG